MTRDEIINLFIVWTVSKLEQIGSGNPNSRIRPLPIETINEMSERLAIELIRTHTKHGEFLMQGTSDYGPIGALFTVGEDMRKEGRRLGLRFKLRGEMRVDLGPEGLKVRYGHYGQAESIVKPTARGGYVEISVCNVCGSKRDGRCPCLWASKDGKCRVCGGSKRCVCRGRWG